MKSIPHSILHVDIPQAWTPSQLASGTECDLRAIFAATNRVPALLSNPRASLGSVVHQLLENAAKGSIDRSLGLREAVTAEFQRLLQLKEERLKCSEETSHFVPLSEAFTQLEWHNHVQANLVTAQSLLATAPLPRRVPFNSRQWNNQTFADLTGPGKWPEVAIDAQSLRLYGRMDYVEIESGMKVYIRDYKGGRVLQHDGTIYPTIELQLRLYGLAVLAQRPESQIRLTVLSASREYQISFDDHHVNETRNWLNEFLSRVPAGVAQRTERFANVGAACSYCSNRHVCPAYIRDAPKMIWERGVAATPPAGDVWGTVSGLQFQNGLCNLEVLTESGHRVRVQRLHSDRHQLDTLRMGQQIWMFGLSSSRIRMRGGRFIHPKNFFELPISLSERRAWSLIVFGD